MVASNSRRLVINTHDASNGDECLPLYPIASPVQPALRRSIVSLNINFKRNGRPSMYIIFSIRSKHIATIFGPASVVSIFAPTVCSSLTKLSMADSSGRPSKLTSLRTHSCMIRKISMSCLYNSPRNCINPSHLRFAAADSSLSTAASPSLSLSWGRLASIDLDRTSLPPSTTIYRPRSSIQALS